MGPLRGSSLERQGPEAPQRSSSVERGSRIVDTHGRTFSEYMAAKASAEKEAAVNVAMVKARALAAARTSSSVPRSTRRPTLEGPNRDTRGGGRGVGVQRGEPRGPEPDSAPAQSFSGDHSRRRRRRDLPAEESKEARGPPEGRGQAPEKQPPASQSAPERGRPGAGVRAPGGHLLTATVTLLPSGRMVSLEPFSSALPLAELKALIEPRAGVLARDQVTHHREPSGSATVWRRHPGWLSAAERDFIFVSPLQISYLTSLPSSGVPTRQRLLMSGTPLEDDAKSLAGYGCRTRRAQLVLVQVTQTQTSTFNQAVGQLWLPLPPQGPARARAGNLS